MDKVMKAEIEKILESVLGIHAVNGANGGYKTCSCLGCKETRRTMPIAISSLTSLIIKWLENADICDKCKNKLLTNLTDRI